MRPTQKKYKRNQSKSQRRRAIYVLPNLFTTASLFSGFYAILAAMAGDFPQAAVAILASLVLDGLDGKVARATNTVSRFGVEYDSLADVVAFGVAPAVLILNWALKPMGRLGWLAAFLFVACGALRLARFNVQVERVGTKHFVGLPIPAAASLIATTVLLLDVLGLSQAGEYWPVLIMVFALSFLMVSNIRYFSFKELNLGRIKSFNWLVAALLFFILIAVQPQVVSFLVVAAYVALGPFAARIMHRRRLAQDQSKQAEQALSSSDSQA